MAAGPLEGLIACRLHGHGIFSKKLALLLLTFRGICQYLLHVKSIRYWAKRRRCFHPRVHSLITGLFFLLKSLTYRILVFLSISIYVYCTKPLFWQLCHSFYSAPKYIIILNKGNYQFLYVVLYVPCKLKNMSKNRNQVLRGPHE